MNFSFYSGAVGAQSMQERMNVISNNIANLNTEGYKTKNGTFSDLVYSQMGSGQGVQAGLTHGSGSKLSKTDTIFAQGNLTQTGLPLDYAINGDGFFALYNTETQKRTYTRSGSFQLSRQQGGEFYITDGNGKWVLDQNGNPITAQSPEGEHPIGVFVFDQKNGMQSVGNSEFIPVEKNGTPTATDGQGVLIQGAVEDSNVDFSKEMAEILQTQRVYQMSLKMVQTSDEIESTINSLR